MNLYSIVVSGIGSESYIFSIDDEQYSLTTDIDTSSTLEFINSLGFGDPGDADIIITGAYEEDVLVSVFDEDGDNIFLSTEYNSNISSEYYLNGLESKNHFIYENKVSGDFFKFDFNSDDFDPEKINLIFVSVGDNNILINVEYDGYDLRESKEYLDYTSFDEEIYKVRGVE